MGEHFPFHMKNTFFGGTQTVSAHSETPFDNIKWGGDVARWGTFQAVAKGIFLWLPYANIFTTGPPVFVNSPFRLGKITNCSVETVSRHFSFL